jgi:ATP-dependent exoDNAse (exonuclease V) beta subunit
MTPSVESAAFGCFVEASAGTGKTHTLVTEIAAAIERKVPIDRIAAVTFQMVEANFQRFRMQ